MVKTGTLHCLWSGVLILSSSFFIGVTESFELLNVARRSVPTITSSRTTTQLYNHNNYNGGGGGFHDPNTRRDYNIKSNDWWKDSSQQQQQQPQQQQRRVSYADNHNGLVRDISDFRSSQRRHPQQVQQRVNYNTSRETPPDTPWKRSSSFPQTRSSARTAPYPSQQQQQQPRRSYSSTSGYTRRTPTYQSPDPNFPSSNSRFPTTTTSSSSRSSSNTAPAPWERQHRNYDPPPRRATFDQPLQQQQGLVRKSRRNNRQRFPNTNGINSNDFVYHLNDDDYGSESTSPQDTGSDESAASSTHLLESEILELKQQISNMTKERENLLETLMQVQDNMNRAVRMAESSAAVASARKQKMSSTKQEQTMMTTMSTNDTSSYPATTSQPSSFFFKNDNEWNNATGTITSSSSLNAEDGNDDQQQQELNYDSSLDTLLNGISMTQETLEKVLQDGGLEKYGAAGEEFDPHYHTALFAFPDPNREPGTIADVITDGYRMKTQPKKDSNINGVDQQHQPAYKVLRYAEVSVVKEE